MAGGSSWRSTSTADQYRNHDYADFAQEFLQRNTDYRCDHAETLARIAGHPHTKAIEEEGLAGRWGLSFPLSARSQSTRGSGPLVTSSSSRRRIA
jgi:Family of unknown function (DUF6499)